MKNRLPIAAALVLSSLGSAQVTTTFRTAGATQAVAWLGAGSSRQSLPNDTDLKPGKKLFASYSSGVGSISADFEESANRITVRLDGLSSGTRSNGIGRFDFNAKLSLRAGTTSKAKVRVTWRYQFHSDAFGIHADVDLGSFGRFRHLASRSPKQGSATREFPITIDSKGLDVKLTYSASAGSSFSGNNTSSLRVEVVPVSGCGFLAHGVPCGPDLTGACGFGGRVTLASKGGPLTGNGLLVLGTNQIAVPIPGTGCQLYTTPSIVQPIQFRFGVWTLTRTLPAARPFTTTAQVAVLGSKLQASNGLILSAPR